MNIDVTIMLAALAPCINPVRPYDNDVDRVGQQDFNLLNVRFIVVFITLYCLTW